MVSRDKNKFPADNMKSSGCYAARKLEKKEMSHNAISMRVRRRQSDAKWRASVASCYDTLKFIIQDSKKIAKKKISKSLVLEETEKHINNLENALGSLFNHQANESGKAVLWKKGQQWCLASLDELHTDFKEKQSELFLPTSQGKRRYNLLSEIQQQILDMSVDLSKISILPLTEVETKKIEENHYTDEDQSYHANTMVNDYPHQAHSTPHGKHPMYGMYGNNETRDANGPMRAYPMSTMMSSRKTPLKDKMIGGFHDDNEEFFVPLGLNTPMYSRDAKIDSIKREPMGVRKVAKKLTFMTADEVTPAKTECVDSALLKSPMTNFGFTPIKLPNESNLGFTPIKLPSEPWLLGTTNERISPIKNTWSDPTLSQVSANDYKMSGTEVEESKILLCLETFDVLDQEESDIYTQESTPEKQPQNRINHCGMRRARIQAFKRKLELDKVKSRKKSKSSHVPRCRKQLELFYPKEEKIDKTDSYSEELFCQQDNETALAALEISADSNSNSAISRDLLDLDVKPIDFTAFLKKENAVKQEWQRVPVMEVQPEESNKLANQLVPEQYFQASTEERQRSVNVVFTGQAFVEELGENRCQIVPEIIVKNDVMFSSTRRSPPPVCSEEIVLSYI